MTGTLKAFLPHAGKPYAVRMAFGPRARRDRRRSHVRCRARVAGKRLKSSGRHRRSRRDVQLEAPGGARGERLKMTVKISGRHGVSLVRRANLIVGD